MAISNINSPISADLMYQFYDNKAITPQIRAALQKRQDAEDAANANASSKPGSDPLKPGPATRVNITDQIIRMNMSNNTTKKESKEETPETSEASTARKPSRYDVLAEVKKSVSAREAEARKEKDAQLQEIKDKIAAEEAAKKAEEDAAKKAEEEAKNPTTPGSEG